jgi:hypothetical protein
MRILHRSRLTKQQCLGSEDVLDLGRADTKGKGAQPTVRRGMTVAADHREARQSETLLRPDHVHDPLLSGTERDLLDVKLGTVSIKRCELLRGLRIRIRQVSVDRRYVVIRNRKRQVGTEYASASSAQAIERLRCSHLMYQVAIDRDERRSVRTGQDDVIIPDLLIERAALVILVRHGHQLPVSVSMSSGLRSITADRRDTSLPSNGAHTLRVFVAQSVRPGTRCGRTDLQRWLSGP